MTNPVNGKHPLFQHTLPGYIPRMPKPMTPQAVMLNSMNNVHIPQLPMPNCALHRPTIFTYLSSDINKIVMQVFIINFKAIIFIICTHLTAFTPSKYQWLTHMG